MLRLRTSKNAPMPRALLGCTAGMKCLMAPVLVLCFALCAMTPAVAQDSTLQKPAAESVQAPVARAASEEAAQPERPVDAATAPVPRSRSLPHDLSPWGMFLAADIIVKIVMVGLAFASFVTWTVWLAKSLELLANRRRAERQLGMLAHAQNLNEAERDLQDGKGPLARMLAGVIGEVQRSADLAEPGIVGHAKEGIKERAAALIARIEARAGRQMNRGTGVLATIGATAPFVGLFGTVWGIMNSFIGISKTNTTNLAVVAPGIAEALLATAIGLVAAIPAVMIYNVFARSIAAYRAILGDGAAEILRHLSRDLDRAAPGGTQGGAQPDDWHVVAMRRSAE
jgi:biopolymer transport protein ExbB